MKIISFSGIDGSGKTSISKSLAEKFSSNGIPSKYMRPAYNNNSLVKKYCGQKFNDEHAYYTKLNSDFYISSLTLDWLDWWYNQIKEECDFLFIDRYIIDVYTQALQYNADVTIVNPLFDAIG